MIVNVMGELIATEHIFSIAPIPEDFTIHDEDDRLFFIVTGITGKEIDIGGETLKEVASKIFPNVYLLSNNQKITALNTAVANLERVREKLIEYWNSNKFHVPKITL